MHTNPKKTGAHTIYLRYMKNIIYKLFHKHDFKLPRWAYFAADRLSGKTTAIECQCSCGEKATKDISVASPQ